LAKFNDEVLRVATYENQHAEIKDKLTSIEKEAGAAKEEKEQLQKQLLDVETKWKKAQDELKETRAKLDRSVLSGVVPSSGITATKVSLADLAPTKVLGLTFKRKCTKCGKEYTPTGITIGPDYCPDCNTISLGGIGVGR